MNELRPISIMADGQKIAEGLRVRVRGSLNMTLLPDFFIVEIYNLSPDDNYILTDAKKLTVSGKEEYIICTGEISDIYSRTEGTNTVTGIAVSDGESFWKTKINKSVGGGASISNTIREILSNADFGGYLANDIRIQRGQCYTGSLAEAISMLAKSGNGRAFFTKGVLYVVKKGTATEIIEIEEDDIINDENYAKGVRTIKTEAKGYPMGSLVTVNGRQYRLVSQKVSLDNYEGDWASNIVLVDESELSKEGMVGG